MNQPGAATGALIEEGAAFRDFAVQRRVRFDVVVVGAGQAGLSVGYHLARRGVRFVILDAEKRVGDTWRKRWDSLRLFTPARYDALDGMRFPAPGDHFPTKDEMADYLEAYAQRFALPIRSGVRVERLFARDGRYVLRTSGGEIEADQVVVAMASYQRPRVPALASQLASDVNQLHSSRYRGPGQMRTGDVLLVGAGNSGAEIAVELARRGHSVYLSGPDVGHVPFRVAGWLGQRIVGPFVLRVLFHRLLTVRTLLGRRVRPGILGKGAPLIRTRPRELAAAGIVRVARVTGVRDGKPLLADGRVLEVSNVVWCTGFHTGMSWIDLPILDEHGEPRHVAGEVEDAPGLWFVGLHFLYAMSSSMIHGVGRDAARIANAVAKLAREIA